MGHVNILFKGDVMKLGAKNIEWLFIAALVVITITEFLMLGGGMMSSTPQTTMIAMGLLMVSAAQIITAILLIRIYDKLDRLK